MGHGSEVWSLVTGLNTQSWQDWLWGAAKPRSPIFEWIFAPEQGGPMAITFAVCQINFIDIVPLKVHE